MCKNTECQAVTAYKDISGAFHTTPDACHRSNQAIKERRTQTAAEDIFETIYGNSRYMSSDVRWVKSQLIRLFASRWMTIRDELNRLYEQTQKV